MPSLLAQRGEIAPYSCCILPALSTKPFGRCCYSFPSLIWGQLCRFVSWQGLGEWKCLIWLRATEYIFGLKVFCKICYRECSDFWRVSSVFNSSDLLCRGPSTITNSKMHRQSCPLPSLVGGFSVCFFFCYWVLSHHNNGTYIQCNQLSLSCW